MPKGSLSRVEHAHWLKQARFIAHQIARRHPDLVEDMAAEAMVSLVESLRSFDPTRNVSLGSYVFKRMEWAVLDAMRAGPWAGSRADSARGMFYAHVPLDEALDTPTLPAANTDGIDLERAVAQLPARRRAYIEAYLRLGDVALAAATVGMTANCAGQHHHKAVRALRKLMV